MDQNNNPRPQPNWQKALDELGDGTGPFFFFKSKKTNLRLVCLEDDPEKFFAGATTYFKGKPKTKYIVFGQVLKTADKELSDKWKGKIVPLVLTKTAIKSIISLLAEGYELFDPAQGYGIVLMKSGAGTDTEYNIMPSPNPVPIDFSKLEMPEKSLEDYADDLTAKGQNNENNKSKEDW